jgi:hypothetical protein
VNPTDRIRTRTVKNLLRLIREHLESMQRDVYGLEYEPWKKEVDALWKRVFEQISFMSHQPQQGALETIRELWTMYLAHYATGDREKVEGDA